jgi:flagellar motor protein MotB
MADHHEEHHDDGGHKAHKGGHGGHGGGGGHAEGEHEGAPEWLISFADNVALLMGFFVILLAMNMKEPQAGGIGGIDGPNSPQPSKQWLDMVIAIRESFHSRIDMNSTDPREATLRQRLLEREREISGESIIDAPEGGKRDVQSTRPSDYVVPTASIPFEFGSIDLSESNRKSARDDARTLAGKLNVVIEVRGHVSAMESKRDQDKGYELSFKRARTVARIMAEEGIPWKHIRIVACSDASPVTARADTAGDHRTNQRVELVIIQERPEPDQFSDDTGANAADPH